MSSVDLIAFLDESCKPIRGNSGQESPDRSRWSFYAAAVAVVLRGDMAKMRSDLQQIGTQFTSGLHYSSLSRRQRLAAMVFVEGLAGWDGLVVETTRPVVVRNDRTLRGAVLATAIRDLANEWGVRHMVIESRAHPSGRFAKLDRDDTLLVAGLRDKGQISPDFRTEHASKDELILGLADLLAGARTDWLCGLDRGPWSVVQHRMSLHSVPPRWK